MVAYYDAVPIAVTYAAINRGKVSCLVLADGWMKDSDWDHDSGVVLRALRGGDWTVYSETYARLRLGFDNQEFAAQFAAYVRECVEPQAVLSAYSSQGIDAWDVSALLPRVTAHTLVVHNRKNRLLPVQAGQRLAARIPDARFQVVDDMGYEKLPGIITRFLGESDQIAHRRFDSLPAGTAIILFADIADSTALTERLGDAAFREKARDLDASLRTIIREHAGTPVDGKLVGDGVLAVFTSARQAIEAARASGEAGRHA